MEINQKANLDVQQAQVGKKLSFIHRMEGTLAFGFNHDSIFDHQISTKATIEFYRLVDKWNRLLPLHAKTKKLKFMR